MIPYLRIGSLKTIPYRAAHTYIAHIWEYSPSPGLRWTSISSRLEEEYSKVRNAKETGISSGLMGHLSSHLPSFSPSKVIKWDVRPSFYTTLLNCDSNFKIVSI